MPEQPATAPTIERVAYLIDGAEYEGVLVTQPGASGDYPLILHAPNFLGLNESAIDRARLLARNDRNVFVVDIYGRDKRPVDMEAAFAIMAALEKEPLQVRARMHGALLAAKRAILDRYGAEPLRAVAIGFCFGGGNVLELARSGAGLDAFIAVHGSLETSMPAEPGAVRAPVLIAHGAADPLVRKAARDAIEQELDAAGATWSMLLFGGVLHAYTELDVPESPVSRPDPVATASTYRAVDELIARVCGPA